MLDKWTLNWVKPVAEKIARGLKKIHITPDQVSVMGFIVGMLAIPALWQHQYYLAAGMIAINRLCDGIDGTLARLYGPTDAGGYLDITLDFLFYSGVVWGFALADPGKNALAACDS